jgi:deoxyribodipyrimidine photo-lyase
LSTLLRAKESDLKSAVVLFNRDLRVHDHPALASAIRAADTVVPLFVFDGHILGGDFARPNRTKFLVDCVLALRAELEGRGGTIFVRRGDPVRETMELAATTGADAIYVTEDYSSYGLQRQDRLRRACDAAGLSFVTLPGLAVIEPGELEPSGGDHFRVFTRYWRRWEVAAKRSLAATPRKIRIPSGLRKGRIPAAGELVAGESSPDLPEGGEAVGRRHLSRWLSNGVAEYGDRHDDLAGDATSRLSPYLHFGCLSPLEMVARASGRPGADAFIRQLCWRDFHLQVLAARHDLSTTDYRPRNDRWRNAPDDLDAWKRGLTGIPIVDAGMRQLAREGYMHNRARLITASFLTKDLYIDWRLGARHFWDLLVDGDIANNSGNWQWVAGTGNDTRPNRIFNPIRQAHRFDPHGDYVRRYVTELAGVKGSAVHEPWKLAPDVRKAIDYPEPLVDHAEAVQSFRRRRG